MYSLKLIARTIAGCIALGVFASNAVAAPPAPPSTMPAGAKAPPPQIRDVEQVQIGKPATATPSPGVGAPPVTPGAQPAPSANPGRDGRADRLKVLEDLQFQIAEAELRKRLAEAKGTPVTGASNSAGVVAPPSAPTVKPQVAPSPSAPKASKGRAKASQAAPAVATNPAMGVVSLVPPPRPPEPPIPDAKVLNFVAIGDRIRAEILFEGRQVTMKIGDKIGAWSVSEVTGDGVFVEHRRMVKDLRPEFKAAIAAGQPSPAVGPTGPFVDAEEVLRKRLEPMQQTMAAATPAPLQAKPSAPIAPVVVPPLPGTVRAPDSTSLPAAPPLPSNGNGLPQGAPLQPLPPIAPAGR